MKNIPLKILAGCIFGIALVHSIRVTANSDNPHMANQSVDSKICASCHINSPENRGVAAVLETKNKSVKLADFKNDGVTMCTGCHNPNDGHKIGLKLDFDVPADLPLDKKNTLSCLTCHYTHGRLDSDRPQASHSFMDRLVNADRLHKSFLLRRNNEDGELCLICHNSTQGKK